MHFNENVPKNGSFFFAGSEFISENLFAWKMALFEDKINIRTSFMRTTWAVRTKTRFRYAISPFQWIENCHFNESKIAHMHKYLHHAHFSAIFTHKLAYAMLLCMPIIFTTLFAPYSVAWTANGITNHQTRCSCHQFPFSGNFCHYFVTLSPYKLQSSHIHQHKLQYQPLELLEKGKKLGLSSPFLTWFFRNLRRIPITLAQFLRTLVYTNAQKSSFEYFVEIIKRCFYGKNYDAAVDFPF